MLDEPVHSLPCRLAVIRGIALGKRHDLIVEVPHVEFLQRAELALQRCDLRIEIG